MKVLQRIIVLLTLLPSTAYCASGFVLASGAQRTASVTVNQGPTLRVEARYISTIGAGWTDAGAVLFTLAPTGGGGCNYVLYTRVIGGTRYMQYSAECQTNTGGGGARRIDLTSFETGGAVDLLVRTQWDSVKNISSLLVCRGDGTSCLRQEESMAAGTTNTNGTLTMPYLNSGVGGTLAFVRMYSTPAEGDLVPPLIYDTTGGNIVNAVLNGTFTDSGPNAYTFSGSGGSYTGPLPVYPPTCNAGRLSGLGAEVNFNALGLGPTLRAGHPNTLSGSGVQNTGDAGGVTYAWHQLSGPSAVEWVSGRSTLTPVVRGLINTTFAAAPYTFQLTVKDSLGVSVSCHALYSAVPTDNSGRVILPDSRLAIIYKAMTRDTLDVYPYLRNRLTDFTQQLLIDLWTTRYVREWETLQTGTVTRSPDGATIIGTGTDFQQLFCYGTATPQPTSTINTAGTTVTRTAGASFTASMVGTTIRIVNGAGNESLYIVAAYTNANSITLASDAGTQTGSTLTFQNWQFVVRWASGTRYRNIPIVSCNSATSITVLDGGARTKFEGDESDMAYARVSDANQANWVDGAAGTGSANYYDRNLANIAYGLRSGQPVIMQWARDFADAWWKSPWNDQGGYCDLGNGYGCAAPRYNPLLGMIARAIVGDIDAGSLGASYVWAGLNRKFLNTTDFYSQIGINSTIIGDPREEGFIHGALAACVLFMPQPTYAALKASCKTALQDMTINKWNAFKTVDPAGGYYWASPANVIDPWNQGDIGTVTMTAGSPVVTGFGATNFLTRLKNLTANTVAFSAFLTSSALDTSYLTNSYYIQSVDSNTQVTLASNWTGPTTSGMYWQAGNLVRRGVQPFLMGIAGTFFDLAREAYLAEGDTTRAAVALDLLNGAAMFFARSAKTPDRGTYYGAYYANCQPPLNLSMHPNCVGTVGANREFAQDLIRTMLLANLASPNSEILAAVDDYVDAAWNKPGDGNYLKELDNPNGFYFSPTGRYNVFNLGAGMGGVQSWQGTRLGAMPGPDVRTVSLSFTPPAGATTVMNCQAPDAKPSTVSCSAGRCSLSFDFRQGNPVCQLVHSVSAGVTSSPVLPLIVQ